MSDSESRAPGDLPAAFYRKIQAEVQTRPAGGGAASVACAVFIVATLLLLIALEAGIDIELILSGAVVIVVVNLVAGVVWVSGQRSR